jgi:microsomal dipeptidase-like Zn-dependent dipeptidase
MENGNMFGDACFFFNPPGLKVGKVHKDMDLSFGFLSLYRTPPPMLKTMELVEKEAVIVTNEILKLKEKIHFLQCGENLGLILKMKHKAITLSLQGLPKDANAKKLRQLGIRVVPLMYGSGSGCEDFFTPERERFARECIDEGIKIDLAHCNHKTARSVIRFAEKIDAKGVVIATHTGCHSVYSDPRNLPDDVIKSIADMDGMVGISSITFHLSNDDDTISPLLNHIQYAVSLCGENKVVIGSDRPYITMGEKWWEKRTKWMQENLDTKGEMGIRWPDQAFILNTPNKMSMIHSELVDSKFCNKELADKITGGNLHRFIMTYM